MNNHSGDAQVSKNKILVLSSIYPAPDFVDESTPVVHYFAREWVKSGYDVRVVNFPANFPKLLMYGASLFKKTISSRYGSAVRTFQVGCKEYTIDGVRVKRIPLLKYRLHGRYSSREIEKAYNSVLSWLEQEHFSPDFISSHWVNPQLEIMERLKSHFHSITCYIAHTPTVELTNIYKKDDICKLLSSIDLIGFRSEFIKRRFLDSFCYNGSTFLCYSGVPEQYVPNSVVERTFEGVHRFVFVGTLIKRKYPAEIIPALVKAFHDDSFEINYVGRGAEEKKIIFNANRFRASDKVHLLGRLSRGEVVSELRKSEVFIMNSRAEAFGLVYLEAMAQGCITIASKNEGFDGIIVDGVNGFLCEAGNIEDLSRAIGKIRSMAPEDLKTISHNAYLTAKKLTDKNVAQHYIKQFFQSDDFLSHSNGMANENAIK